MNDDEILNLTLGTKLRKVDGDYQTNCTLRQHVWTGAGKLRVVCEFDDIPGVLHIFAPSQLVQQGENITKEKQNEAQKYFNKNFWNIALKD